MGKGWTGKRLHIDLSLQRAWTEEIAPQDLDSCVGGRYLNGKFLLEQAPSPVSPSSSECPIALAVGPLAGTCAPCSGWTSISAISPLSDPPGYVHVSMPGHWGPQLKFAGFDQCIIKGRGDHPLYLWIDGNKVRFEDASPLWGKDTVETTVTIQEEKEDRNAEVLCIGPAGERGVPFANVVNRFSWTGDRVGLGYSFGAKNLKAIAIRGYQPVALDRPESFLDLCLALAKRIDRDGISSKLKEEGTFFFLGNEGIGLGVKNFHKVSSPDHEKNWKTLYLKEFLYGREGCFSCPIHCGRVTHMGRDYFGGFHLEGAWSLGPRIGIDDWVSTIRLYRLCQTQGLDPCSAGSLLSWIMDAFEERALSGRDLGNIECGWGDVEAALRVIERVVSGKDAGEMFRMGSLRAAKRLGKGLDLVAHTHGMDLPVRDPRSSMEYAVSLSLFPAEWDYLRSLSSKDLSPSKESVIDETGASASATQELKILADLTSFCPLVVARFPLISVSDIAELTRAATGSAADASTLMQEVRKTIQIENKLSEKMKGGESTLDALSPRFFKDPSYSGPPLSKDLFEREISRQDQQKSWDSPVKKEKEE
jgi:aldehyde:ferredoxin oxidoreductase